MKFGLRETIEIFGVVSIVGSLVFVGLELNQAQQVALNESGYYIVDSGIERANIINEHPDIWARGNAGEELSIEDKVIYDNQLLVRWAIAFWTAQTSRRLGRDLDVSLHDFASFLHRNPGARATWQENSDVEQEYRGILLNGPAGQAEVELVIADLERLDNLGTE